MRADFAEGYGLSADFYGVFGGGAGVHGGGLVRSKGEGQGHDDLVFAVALACWRARTVIHGFQARPLPGIPQERESLDLAQVLRPMWSAI